MGRHHRQTTLKRRVDLFMDRNADQDKITINTTIRTVIAAAALTLKVFYRFSDAKVREFVDDMDLRMEPMLQDPEVVIDVLDGLDIEVRTDIMTDADNRILIRRQDRNLCESCARCTQNDPVFHGKYGRFACQTKGLRFRRGRSVCSMWVSRMNSWQRKILDAGGPGKHMDL